MCCGESHCIIYMACDFKICFMSEYLQPNSYNTNKQHVKDNIIETNKRTTWQQKMTEKLQLWHYDLIFATIQIASMHKQQY